MIGKCLNCGEKTELAQRTSIPKKYCSKQCANEFFTKEGRYNKHKKPGSNWGTLTAKRLEKRKAYVEAQLKWAQANLISKDKLVKELSRSKHSIFHRQKILEIVPTYIIVAQLAQLIS